MNLGSGDHNGSEAGLSVLNHGSAESGLRLSNELRPWLLPNLTGTDGNSCGRSGVRDNLCCENRLDVCAGQNYGLWNDYRGGADIRLGYENIGEDCRGNNLS